MNHTRHRRAFIARLSIVSMLTMAFGCSVASAGFIIDDFSDVQEPSQWPVVRNTLGTTNITEAGLSGVLGGVREASVTADFLDTPGLDNITVTAAPTPAGVFDYASTAGAEGSIGLLYDGGASLNADFSTVTSFSIDFLYFDLANTDPLNISITLTDNGGDSATGMISLVSDGAQNAIIAIGSFVEDGGGTTDLNSIRSVRVFFDGALATDFRIDSISTAQVPAPGALALLGIGGLVRRSRRRKN